MRKQIALVGGGHAHLFVVSQAEAFRAAGAELCLIDPGRLWYSGMATGMLGGMYAPAQDQVDLKALCGKNHVVFHQTRAVSLDRKTKTLQTESGQVLPYDLLSLNVGSTVDTSHISDPDAAAWTVKPIPRLMDLQTRLAGYARAGRACAVGVVGGGPTGAEIAANIQAFCRRAGVRASLTLMHGGTRLLPGFPEKAAQTLHRIFDKRDIEICLQTRTAGLRRQDRHQICARTTDGRAFTFDEVVLATGLAPSPAVAALGLGDNGLAVDTHLTSLEDQSIFGAGDCIRFAARELPKVGVFGVREAPVLTGNLLASLSGGSPEPYQPQETFLIIMNLGDGTGLAIRGNRHWHGRLALLSKHFIDTHFMKRYRQSKPVVVSGNT